MKYKKALKTALLSSAIVAPLLTVTGIVSSCSNSIKRQTWTDFKMYATRTTISEFMKTNDSISGWNIGDISFVGDENNSNKFFTANNDDKTISVTLKNNISKDSGHYKANFVIDYNFVKYNLDNWTASVVWDSR